ncbi:MAG: flavodoxin [Eubacterium sp.]|nr:flavodoxin [Eubacterium sp.]
MAKLTVFYSRAGENYFAGEYRHLNVGNTEKAAKIVAKTANSDIFKIEQKNSYSSSYSVCIKQAREDLRNNARPELVVLPKSIDKYEEIYLGYPNYWRNMPMAVYTFLESFDWTGKAIHPFCTHEGSGFADTAKELKRVCKGARIKKGLAILGSDIDNAETAIKNWIIG